MSDPSDFSPDSILGHIRLDIYGDNKSGDVNIFHEGEFEDEIIRFEYDSRQSILYFVFSDETRMELGAPVGAKLIPFFLEAPNIGLFQVLPDKTAGKASEVPLVQL